MPELADSSYAAVSTGGDDGLLAVVGIASDVEDHAGVARMIARMPRNAGLSFVVLPSARGGRFRPSERALGDRALHGDVTRAILEPDHVYLAPPGSEVVWRRSSLEISGPGGSEEQAFDRFFASLAEVQNERAVGILLSPEAHRGASGLNAIDTAGGCALGPSSWSRRGAASPSGPPPLAHLVEVVPERVLRRVTRLLLARGRLPERTQVRQRMADLRAAFCAAGAADLERHHAGLTVDRVLRRMAMLGVTTLEDYLERCAGAAEAEALGAELQRTGRRFFEEERSASRLSALIADLEDGPRPSPGRIWVPGCGSGEGVYGIAMLLAEQRERTGRARGTQIFGTDAEPLAIRMARKGRYPTAALETVRKDRRRFFTETDGMGEVTREVRRPVLFAPHDVFSDSPFSRIDLLCARWAFAQGPPELYERLLESFHFALRAGGVLFMGPGDFIPISEELFEPIEREMGLYRARPTAVLRAATCDPKVQKLEARLAESRREAEAAACEREASDQATLAMNEALRQTKKELSETALALQASREELRAVAGELQGVSEQRLAELEALDRASTDLTNFVDATEVLACICDAELRVTRSSKALAKLLGREAIDRGTLLDDLASQLPGGLELVAAARAVQRDNQQQQRMEHQPGRPPRTFLVRLLPYRTRRGEIDGVVLVLTDVTEMEEARAVAARRERQQAVVAELGLAALGGSPAEAAGLKEPSSLYSRALHALGEVLGCSCGVMLELVDEPPAMLVHATLGLKARAGTRLVPLPERASAFEVFSSHEAAVVSEPGAGTILSPLIAEGRPRTGVVCPLRVGHALYGAVGVYSDWPQDFATEDLHFVQAVANVLAGAISRQRARRRLSLENAIGFGISEARDLPSMARRVEQTLAATLDAEGVGMWAPDEAHPGTLLRFWRPGSAGGGGAEPTQALADPETAADADLDASPEVLEAYQTGRICSTSRAEGDVSKGEVGIDIAFPVLLAGTVIAVVCCRRCQALAVDDELELGLARAGRAIGECLHRLRIGAALRDSERRYREQSAELEAIYATLPVGLSIYGRDMRLLRANPRLEEIKGSSLEKRSWERRETILRQVLDSGESVRDVELTTRSEHGVRSWLCSFAPVKDNEGRVAAVSSVVQDITDRKRMEQALREADRQKDEFLAMLGHELRNPLSAIRNATELLGLVGRDRHDLDRVHGVLDRQTTQMAKLIDGLLDVSRVVRGKLHLDRSTLDLARLLRDMLADRHEQLAERCLELDIPDDPLWVEGDAVRLVQIFDNILSNALKFTPPGGRIAVVAETADGRARVRFEDDGAGIEPALLPHIFEPFRQASQTIDRSMGGLGLGLALVRGLVELHGGTIAVESDGNERGAAFTVELALTQRAGVPSSIRPARVTSLRLLVIEDNLDMAKMLEDLLAAKGHEVTHAASGREGIERALALPPDVVLCDIGLPGEVDGLDVARALRSQPALHDTRLIALTGYGGTEYQSRTEEAGFELCLTKPAPLDVLEQVLDRCARGRALK